MSKMFSEIMIHCSIVVDVGLKRNLIKNEVWKVGGKQNGFTLYNTRSNKMKVDLLQVASSDNFLEKNPTALHYRYCSNIWINYYYK